MDEADKSVELGTEDLEATVAMRDAMNRRRCYLLIASILFLGISAAVFYLYSQHQSQMMYFWFGLILLGISIVCAWLVYCFR